MRTEPEPQKHPANVLLIRHGEKTADLVDPELTPLGALQALQSGEKLGAKWSAQSENIEIKVSPYRRTLETAILSMARASLGAGQIPTIILEPDLSERYNNEDCRGMDSPLLLQWLKGPGPEGLSARIAEFIDNNAAQLGCADPQALKDRAADIIKQLDTQRISLDKPKWWPYTEEGHTPLEPLPNAKPGDEHREAKSHLIERVSRVVRSRSPGKTLLCFTHSTAMGNYMAHIMRDQFTKAAEGDLGAPGEPKPEKSGVAYCEIAGFYDADGPIVINRVRARPPNPQYVGTFIPPASEIPKVLYERTGLDLS